VKAMSNCAEFIIKNDISELAGLAAKAHEFLDPMELPMKQVYAFDLALEEMLTNTIKYAYDTPGAHEITVKISVDEKLILLSLIDDGHEFNPLEIQKPDLDADISERAVGGVGIHLTKNMVDDMKYRRENERNVLEIFINLQ
jgi:serine/threonine-protein kinase RsbW